MPGPYRAAAGKPPAVRKRPRRGQDPSLRTDPSTSARTPPQVRAAARQRAVTHVGGGGPDAPETSCRHKHTGRDKSLPYNQPFRHRFPSPPISGKTPGPGMPGPYRAAAGNLHAVRKRPRRGQDPSLRTVPSTGARPLPRGGPVTATKNRGNPFSRDCLGSFINS